MPSRDYYEQTGHAEREARLRILGRRKREIYNKLAMQNHGIVTCYVCLKMVVWPEATLEHIKPRSKGGTDAEENLSISHGACNKKKGNK